MVNFGPLAAEIGSVVWGTPSEFQLVSRLGFVTEATSFTAGQPNFAALNRGCHLYSAGRPSRWALAHIPVYYCFVQNYSCLLTDYSACERLSVITVHVALEDRIT